MRLPERTATLDRFRRYTKHNGNNNDSPDNDTVGILVCSDLAARGIDVPNVDVVVQLQFATNVVAHLHRMGRCGRAGQRTGRGIVFFDEVVEGALAKVVQEAEAQQDRMVLEGSEVLDIDSEGEEVLKGSVKKAFSRKRGFTKKLKKIRREAEQQ
jgi:superfamily II DNA/RNA helicase